MTRTRLLSAVLALSASASLAPDAHSQVILSELVASNTSGIMDEAKQFEDWLEIYNPTSQPVDVSGWYLSDKAARPNKWPIPASTVIPAGGHLLVWCDEDQQDGPMHANFKLSAANGEEVWLYKPDAKTLVDRVKFGPQASDISYGRLFDGRTGDFWVTFPRPTPRAVNDPGLCGGRRYSAGNPNIHAIQLDVVGATQLGKTFNLTLQNGVVNSAFVVFLAGGPAPFEVALNPRFGILIGAPILTLVVPSNASGQAALPLPIPNDPKLDQARAYFQAGGFDVSGLFGSNALEIKICR